MRAGSNGVQSREQNLSREIERASRTRRTAEAAAWAQANRMDGELGINEANGQLLSIWQVARRRSRLTAGAYPGLHQLPHERRTFGPSKYRRLRRPTRLRRSTSDPIHATPTCELAEQGACSAVDAVERLQRRVAGAPSGRHPLEVREALLEVQRGLHVEVSWQLYKGEGNFGLDADDDRHGAPQPRHVGQVVQ
jgi:hypothetical protein